MKKVILLEDIPSKLKPLIEQLEVLPGVQVSKVLYYVSGTRADEDEIQQLTNKLGVEVQIVDAWDFDRIMDELYEDKENIFIFDTALEDENEVFDYLINVSYALAKKEDGRIWFYTQAGPYYKSNITKRFPDNVFEAAADDTVNGMKLNLEGNEKFMECIAS